MRKLSHILASLMTVMLLIWISAAGTALMLASNSDYYKSELRDAGVYSRKNEDGTERRRIIYGVGGDMKKRATLSDEQLDLVCEHIVSYLFGDTGDFDLKLKRLVYTSGEVGYDVSLFGKEAISHMADVKGLIRAIEISLIPSAAVLILLIIYLLRRVRARDIIKYTVRFLMGILAFALLFCLWSYIGATESTPFLLNLWGNLHYIIFAFQSDAYKGSFLSDALVYILTLDFFISAVITVLAVVIGVLAVWLTALALTEKFKKKEP